MRNSLLITAVCDRKAWDVILLLFVAYNAIGNVKGKVSKVLSFAQTLQPQNIGNTNEYP